MGWSDHVGIVEKVSFGKITVIEGNYSNAVKRRILSVNAKNIRGYGVPKYDTKTAEKPQNKAETVVEKKETPEKAAYTLKQFIKDVQKATGAAVDGIAGKETLSKTVTVSAKVNSKHAVVKAIQKRLKSLGFNCGAVDGVVGKNTTAAIMAYQKANKCEVDGEITAKNKTWEKLLGMA